MFSTRLSIIALVPLVLIPVSAEAQSRWNRILTCVVVGPSIREVGAFVNAETNDTVTLKGHTFSRVHPSDAPGYAGSADWYKRGATIIVNSYSFQKYGDPRVLGPAEVERVADYRGVGVYAETGTTGVPMHIYLPSGPGCEFQPYQLTPTAAKAAATGAAFALPARVLPTTVVAMGTTAGSLGPGDALDDDNSYYDEFVYEAPAPQNFTIAMSSTVFDTHLVVGWMENGVFKEIARNNDSNGSNSKASIKTNRPDRIVIRAGSNNRWRTGPYTITLELTQ